MRYLILSDVHANLRGLEAVLEAATGQWDQLLCLGDVVGDGGNPNECCALLRGLDAVCLQGNHDAGVIGAANTGWFNDLAQALLWTRDVLAPENWAWLNQLPETLNVEPEENGALPFTLTHGSLRPPYWEEYLLTSGDAEESLSLLNTPARFFGHTHRAGYYSAPMPLGPNDAITCVRWPHGGELLVPQEGHHTLINPGSCDQPRDGNPNARYALWNNLTGRVQVKETPYDIPAAAAAIRTAQLPLPFAERLLGGW